MICVTRETGQPCRAWTNQDFPSGPLFCKAVSLSPLQNLGSICREGTGWLGKYQSGVSGGTSQKGCPGQGGPQVPPGTEQSFPASLPAPIPPLPAHPTPLLSTDFILRGVLLSKLPRRPRHPPRKAPTLACCPGPLRLSRSATSSLPATH